MRRDLPKNFVPSVPKGYRPTPEEIIRRESWLLYLTKEGYSQSQIAERLGLGTTVVSRHCHKLGIGERKYRNNSLPMGPVDWRNTSPPSEAGRLARSGIIGECLAFLEYLQGNEAPFKLATLLEEESLPGDQLEKLVFLRDRLDDICRLAGDPEFRKMVRKDPQYRR